MLPRPVPRIQNGPTGEYQPQRAPRGVQMACKGWAQEAAMRMLMNSLDPEVADRPQDLIACGTAGKVARDWGTYHAIVESLKGLANHQTLLIRSGRLVGTLETHEQASRVLIVNMGRGGGAPNRERGREFDRLGLVMHGQFSAAGWLYLGAQAALLGTFETFANAAQRHFGGDLTGRLVIAGGMGRMGGAQPLAAVMNGAAFLGIEMDAEKIKRRIRAGYCDFCVNDLDEALRILKNALRQKQAVSVGLVANCAEIMPELARRGVVPDLLTDQTGAHDPLDGYIPAGLSLADASALRGANREEYFKRSKESIARHVRGILELQKLGAVAFEYGNHLRAFVQEQGVEDAYSFPDFVQAYLRPRLAGGRGPISFVALSGEANDIFRADDLLLERFPHNAILHRWVRSARKCVKFQGLPARICWLDREEGAVFGERVNDFVARGELKAPMVIGREYLENGSIGLPLGDPEREDAIADWPPVKALLNATSGASWVSWRVDDDADGGYMLHARHIIVADGTPETAKRIRKVLSDELGVGVVKPADGGGDSAVASAEKKRKKTAPNQKPRER